MKNMKKSFSNIIAREQLVLAKLAIQEASIFAEKDFSELIKKITKEIEILDKEVRNGGKSN